MGFFLHIQVLGGNTKYELSQITMLYITLYLRLASLQPHGCNMTCAIIGCNKWHPHILNIVFFKVASPALTSY